jgi:hypothetical protein
VDGCQEVSCSFIEATGDGSKKLEFGEAVLDRATGLVEFLVVFPLNLAVGLGRYDGGFDCLLQGNRHTLIGIEAFVGKHDSDTRPLPRKADYWRPDALLNPFGLAKTLRSAPTDRPVTRSDARPSCKTTAVAPPCI